MTGYQAGARLRAFAADLAATAAADTGALVLEAMHFAEHVERQYGTAEIAPGSAKKGRSVGSLAALQRANDRRRLEVVR